jgi:hypothetical protein
MNEKEERLKNLDTEKLMDVVKNYRQYGYDEKLRMLAVFNARRKRNFKRTT